MPGSRGQEEVLWKVLGSSNWPILVWSHLWYIVGKGSGLMPVGAEDYREFCWSGQGGRQTREGLSYTRGNQPGQAARWGEAALWEWALAIDAACPASWESLWNPCPLVNHLLVRSFLFLPQELGTPSGDLIKLFNLLFSISFSVFISFWESSSTLFSIPSTEFFHCCFIFFISKGSWTVFSEHFFFYDIYSCFMDARIFLISFIFP